MGIDRRRLLLAQSARRTLTENDTQIAYLSERGYIRKFESMYEIPLAMAQADRPGNSRSTRMMITTGGRPVWMEDSYLYIARSASAEAGIIDSASLSTQIGGQRQYATSCFLQDEKRRNSGGISICVPRSLGGPVVPEIIEYEYDDYYGELFSVAECTYSGSRIADNVSVLFTNADSDQDGNTLVGVNSNIANNVLAAYCMPASGTSKLVLANPPSGSQLILYPITNEVAITRDGRYGFIATDAGIYAGINSGLRNFSYSTSNETGSVLSITISADGNTMYWLKNNQDLWAASISDDKTLQDIFMSKRLVHNFSNLGNVNMVRCSYEGQVVVVSGQEIWGSQDWGRTWTRCETSDDKYEDDRMFAIHAYSPEIIGRGL